jgi:hypothetical protein
MISAAVGVGMRRILWHGRRTIAKVAFAEDRMPSRNVGSKRRATRDAEVPAELAKREAQDRRLGGNAGQRTASNTAHEMARPFCP